MTQADSPSCPTKMYSTSPDDDGDDNDGDGSDDEYDDNVDDDDLAKRLSVLMLFIS